MAILHSSSKADGEDVQQGANTRMRRRSASSEIFTRVDDGWGGETVTVVAEAIVICDNIIIESKIMKRRRQNIAAEISKYDD